MAVNTEMIDKLVSEEALKGLDTLDKKLISSYEEMERNLAVVQKLVVTYDGLGKTMNEVSKYADEVTKNEKRIIESIQQRNKITEEKNDLSKKEVQENSKLVESTKQLSKVYSDSSKAIIENGKTLKDISKEAFHEATNKIDEQIKTLIVYEARLKNTQKDLKGIEKSLKDNTITAEEYIKSKTELVKKEEYQKQSIKTLSDTIKNNQKIIRTSIGTYDNISAQYSRLKIQINQMTAAEKYNGYSKAELEAHAKSLYEEMSRLQEVTGKHQLKVGQYDRAVTDLTKTFSILDPSIGMLITKLQSISPLKEAWIKTNDKLVSSLKITSRTATILQAALVGLVIGGIYLAIKAYEQWRLQANKTNESIKTTHQNASKEIADVRIAYEKLRSEWLLVSSSVKERTKFIENNKEEFKKLGVEVNNVNDADNLFVKNTSAFIKSLELRAKATASYNIAVEQLEESEKLKAEADFIRNSEPSLWEKAKGTVIETLIGDMGGVGDYRAHQASQTEAEASKAESSAKKSLENYRKFLEEADKLFDEGGFKRPTATSEKGKNDEKKAIQDLAQLRLQIEADNQKEIFENSKAYYENRLEALDTFIQIQSEKIKEAAKYQLSEIGLSENQRILIREKADAELIKLEREASNIRLGITKDFEKEYIISVQDAISERSEMMNQQLQDDLVREAKLYEEQIKQNVDNEEKREKITEDYQRRRLETIRKYNQDAFEYEVEQLQQTLNNTELTEEQKLKLHKKIDDLRKKNAKDLAEFEIQQTEEKVDKMLSIEERFNKALNDKRTQAVLTMWGMAQDMASMYYDSQLQQIDALEKRERQYYDDKLAYLTDNVEAGLMSQEEADARKKILDEAQEEREKGYEQKRKEIQQRQAKWDKANSIVQAGISTAVAVTKALPNLILAGIVGAMGAAQIAMIAAQKIPEYAKGTDYHKGGLAWVGDGGRSEMVILPSGEVWKTPSTDTLVNLPRGTEVLPDFRQAMMNIGNHTSLAQYDDESGKMVFINDEVLRNNTKETNKQLSAINKGISVIRSNNAYTNKKNNTGYRFRNNLTN